MNVFYYDGIWRMDWGLGNPNRTAALIAMLLVAVWSLAALHRKAFWVSLFLSAAFGVCLLHTFSRGGLLAALAGCTVLILWTPRPWPRRRILAVALAAAGLVTYSFLLSAADRYASSWQGDPSVLNRLEIWRHVPKMMADSPEGWGLGNAQEAYMQWYQPFHRTEKYLNLVSLHFTLLAELSWLWRFLYVFAWLAAFLICWPGRTRKISAVPFAILITFFVAGIFTHMGNSWPVYVVPVIAFLAAVLLKVRSHQWPRLRLFATAAALSLATLAGLFLLGASQGGLAVRGNSSITFLGDSPPKIWILPKKDVLGFSFGKTLRSYLQEKKDFPSIGIARRWDDIPSHAVVVWSGESPPGKSEAERLALSRVILLNPACFPAQVTAAFSPAPVTAIFGEFSHSPSQSTWRASGQAVVAEGVGDYLPRWPALLFQALEQQ